MVLLLSAQINEGRGRMSRHFHITSPVLALGILCVPLSSLGDITGYRRIYLGGLLVFTLASIACAFSTTLPMLATARVRLACVGTTENRPKRMPPAWRAKLHSLRPATGAAAPRNEYAATQQNMNIRSGL